MCYHRKRTGRQAGRQGSNCCRLSGAALPSAVHTPRPAAPYAVNHFMRCHPQTCQAQPSIPSIPAPAGHCRTFRRFQSPHSASLYRSQKRPSIPGPAAPAGAFSPRTKPSRVQKMPALHSPTCWALPCPAPAGAGSGCGSAPHFYGPGKKAPRLTGFLRWPPPAGAHARS